jgi:hypothetical protein
MALSMIRILAPEYVYLKTAQRRLKLLIDYPQLTYDDYHFLIQYIQLTCCVFEVLLTFYDFDQH